MKSRKGDTIVTDSGDIQWITVDGKHIPIGAGQTKDEAVKAFFARQDKQKERQIESNKKQADERNAKESEHKLVDEVNSKQFEGDLKDARDSRPDTDKWRVDLHSKEELDERGCKCYVSEGGSTVAVDKSGDIISVCKKMGDTSIKGSDLLKNAVQMGGKKLDSFDGNHDFYVKCGFEPVSYTPFNEQYAPLGWSNSGCGHENVIFYQYVGVGNVKNTDLGSFLKNTKPFTGENGYDDAKAERDKRL